MTGQDIRAFRQRERLSQRDLAALIGVSGGSVCDWEREKRAIPAEHVAAIKRVMSGEIKAKPAVPTPPKPTGKQTSACETCPYWRHMGRKRSETMYCAHLQESGHTRTCGVERTYQRYRALSPLSLDAARAVELGMSYGQYKAMGGENKWRGSKHCPTKSDRSACGLSGATTDAGRRTSRHDARLWTGYMAAKKECRNHPNALGR